MPRQRRAFMRDIGRILVSLVLCGLLAACDNQSGNQTKHRSLADAAAALRSNATVDTSRRGHLSWVGNAKILQNSDCYLLDREYVTVGLGNGVTLRVVYTATQSGVESSIDRSSPVLVELQVNNGTAEGPYYRASPAEIVDSDIATEGDLIFGKTRLEAVNEAARRANPDGIVAEFEFRCS